VAINLIKSELYFSQFAIVIQLVSNDRVMANLFVDFHVSKAKPRLFLTAIVFLIASTVSEYSLQKMLLRVLLDSATS